MAQSTYKSDMSQRGTDHFVTQDHFGINYVAGTNSFRNGSEFDTVATQLGATQLRYPGGTVTEQYFKPGSKVWRHLFEERREQTTASDGKLIEGPARLFEFATANDMAVQFVLPTMNLVTTKNGKVEVDRDAVRDVKALVTDILNGKFGDVDISQFEIGNEYYFHADLTAKEYGAVAKALVNAVDDAIQKFEDKTNLPSDWETPEIAVQAGAGWRPGDNDTILDALSGQALNKVDSVIFHYYTEGLDQVDSRDRHLGQIDEWRAATGNADLNFFVSEWNIYGHDADTGMAQASSLISGFAELIRQGVDIATIWGAQFRWLDAGLTTNFNGTTLDETDTRLSVSGEIIASMQESIVGMELFDISKRALLSGQFDNQDLVVTSFGNDDSVVIYIASRSDEPLKIRLDTQDYFGKTHHIWAETLISVDDPRSTWADESGPYAIGGLPDFDILNSGDIVGQALTLGSHEILRLNVQLSAEGVVMADHNPMTPGAISYDDQLEGSVFGDNITAHIGNDTVLGRGGNDGLRGGAGADSLYGGTGSDILFGDAGDDTLVGGQDHDQVIGGQGNDSVFGGNGNDILIGGNGDDVLRGGDGGDIISAGAGTDVVRGGDGADYFVLARQGSTRIEDFTADDQLTFLGEFASAQDLRDTAVTTASGDLILTTDTGATITFDGAALALEDVINATRDFTASGRKSLDLAHDLNGMNRAAIESFFADLSTTELFERFAGGDPLVLFSTLTARTAGHVLNAIDELKLTSLLDLVGKNGLVLSLGKFNSEQLVRFFDITDSITATNIVTYVGDEKAKSLLDGMDQSDKDRLEPKLFRASATESNDQDAAVFDANPGKKLSGGAGRDDFTGTQRNDILLGGKAKDDLNGRAGADRLSGDKGEDRLSGGDGDDLLLGGGQSDRLEGGRGVDRLRGGDAADRLEGGRGADVLRGEQGADRIEGGVGNDQAFGGHGADRIDGQGQDDLLSGGNGADVIRGGSGSDTVLGGSQSDRLYGGKGRDEVIGGSGHDVLEGGSGFDRLTAGSGHDTLSGGKGDDSLRGQEGNDRLFGGQGGDLLDGGRGNDVMTGGLGPDIFVFRSLGHDVVTDFQVGQDKIALDSTDYALSEVNGNTVLTFDNNSTLTLNDVELLQFQSSNNAFDFG